MKESVLITGASSGFGYELTKLFLKNKYAVVMVAKDKVKLEQAAQSLSTTTDDITLLAKDLGTANAAQEIYDDLQSKNISISYLINNAGFATYGPFIHNDMANEVDELEVNIVTLTKLTKLFARDMVKAGKGYILNVSSTAAFLPGPLMAVYYASKAYVLSFSEALSEELKGTGVSVSVLCPGPSNTGFVKRAHLEKSKLFNGKNTDPKTVAEIAFAGLLNKKTIIIVGLQNQLMTNFVRIIPRSLLRRMVYKIQSPHD